uniref:Insertion element IS150 protein InsJ-like helix-turn-helix domain-containing protein n=1 Tax=uncultured bacterium fosmid pJB39A3 TaxID=1478063 RepID=A0A0H3U9M6_9BACT|nr:hypothetical protein [uncultured bacterium fosmid pJB39A3]
MAKYSYEFKRQVVDEYLSGNVGFRFLANKYGITNRCEIRRWVNAFKTHGDSGLKRSRQQINYTFDFKLHAVELYLSSEVSYQELAMSLGMNNPTLITRWVNDFRVAGLDALRPRKKGRRKTLESFDPMKKETVADTNSVDTSAEHVKELEDELLRLRIENAFLKELRRLRLEDEARARELRESSTASEDNSN